MKISLLVIADYANVAENDKLNIMGIFRNINATQFPARHLSMFIVARLEAELGEFGQTRTCTIILQDPDGKELSKISGDIEIPGIHKGQVPQVNLIINMREVIFHQVGPHQIIIMIDKDYKGSTTLNISQTEKQ